MTQLFLRRILPALLVLAALLGVAPAGAQRPLTLGVSGPASQWRPTVRVNGALRDRALRDALNSGLPVRLHLRVELWRKDVLDQLEGEQEISRAVLRSALDEGYVLEDGRTQRTFGSMAAAEAAL
ncbi:MAG TPA: hypothetical protein VE913_14090, partial [Longimicrobium sp.]|nr:hypothetical protein [Longimicrobium sp.]